MNVIENRVIRILLAIAAGCGAVSSGVIAMGTTTSADWTTPVALITGITATALTAMVTVYRAPIGGGTP